MDLEPRLWRQLACQWGLLPDAQTDFLRLSEAERQSFRDASNESNDLLDVAYEERQGGLLVAKGSNGVAFPIGDDAPIHKYAALFDPRPCFDGLRQSFVWGTQSSAEHHGRDILQKMYEHVPEERECEIIPLAAALMQDKEQKDDLPACFDEVAWPAYFEAIQNDGYYFSVDELLLLAECARVVRDTLALRGVQVRAQQTSISGSFADF